jgi:hypothetical protein
MRRPLRWRLFFFAMKAKRSFFVRAMEARGRRIHPFSEIENSKLNNNPKMLLSQAGKLKC